MKRILCLLLSTAFLLLYACGREEAEPEVILSAPETIPQSETGPAQRTVRVAVSQILADSDLVEELCGRFESETPYRIDLSVNSNSTCISIAQTGKVDVLIAQDGTALSQFVSAGYADESKKLVTNSLVLLGPETDLAEVSSAETIEQAMIRIAHSQSPFVSCYNDSDVYKAEQRLWASSGIVIGNGRTWYKAARLEMSGTIRMADEESAYVLAEKEAYLKLADSVSLKVYMDNYSGLTNTFSVAKIRADLSESVNSEGADALVDWLYSASTQDFVQSFGVNRYCCPIFNME